MDLKRFTSSELRALNRVLQKENRDYSRDLVPIQVPPSKSSIFKAPTRAWRSSQFLVQQYDEKGRIRLSINRTEIDVNNKDYKDGISWDEIQRLKRECGYGDRDAVEIYPADKDVVNVANLRHLWILEPLQCKDAFALVPMIWRNKS